MERDMRADLLQIYRHAVAAVDGRARVREHLVATGLSARVRVVAVGKAAGAMALGACDALGDAVEAVLIITKHGHAVSGFPPGVSVRSIEAGHPVPDEQSLVAGRSLLGFIAGTPRTTALLLLLSGGASALVEVPAEGIALADLQRAHRWLTGCGRDIAAINRVRMQLSGIKGGRLAQRLDGRRSLQLLISNVPGDDPAIIGSGPLTPAPGGAPAWTGAPVWLTEMAARAAPPPLPDDPAFHTIETRLIATAGDARRAAAEHAHRLGYPVHLHEVLVTGEAEAAGRRLVARLLEDPAGVHVWSGETVVTLPAMPGRGGRCQQLALAAAQVLDGCAAHYLLAAGTDGGDGPGAAAGALVDGATLARGQAQGREAARCLREADAGSFLAASGDLLPATVTGTNVMDLMLAGKG